MHHHTRVAQGDQAVGLVTVGKKRTRHGLAHQQRDHRVPGQTCTGITVGGSGQGLMDTEGFFATAVGLAGHIDDGDDGAFVATGDGLIDGLGQPPAFEQADFAIARPREAVLYVRDHGDKAHRLLTQYTVGNPQRLRQTVYQWSAGAQCVEPLQPSHGRSP